MGVDIIMGAISSCYDGSVIDLDGQDRVIERRSGALAAAGTGLRKQVYCVGGGLQIGCTYVTRAAMKKLVAMWIGEQQD